MYKWGLKFKSIQILFLKRSWQGQWFNTWDLKEAMHFESEVDANEYLGRHIDLRELWEPKRIWICQEHLSCSCSGPETEE